MGGPYRYYSDHYYNQYRYGQDRYYASRMHRAPTDDYYYSNSYRPYQPQHPEPLLRVTFQNYHTYRYPIYNTSYIHPMQRTVESVKDHRMMSHNRRRAVKRAAPIDNGPPNKRQHFQTQRTVTTIGQVNSETSPGQNRNGNSGNKSKNTTTQVNIFEFFKNNIKCMLENVMVSEWPKFITQSSTTNSFTPPFLESNKDKVYELLHAQLKQSDKYKELFDLVSEMAPQSPERRSVFYTNILNDTVKNTVPKLIDGYKDLIVKCMQHDILSMIGKELLKYDPPPADLIIIISTTPRYGCTEKDLLEFLKPYKVIKLINHTDPGSYRVKMADLQQYNNLLKENNVTKGKFKFSIKPSQETNADENRNINFQKAITIFNSKKQNTNNTSTVKTQDNATNTCTTISTATSKAYNIKSVVKIVNPLNTRIQNLIENAKSDLDLSLELIEPQIDTIDLTDETYQSNVEVKENVTNVKNDKILVTGAENANFTDKHNAVTENSIPVKTTNKGVSSYFDYFHVM